MKEETFNEKVWNAIKKIPKGKISTYKEIARYLQNKNSSRAVGNACNANPNAPLVPCHRVVANTGFIGGYALGIGKKAELLTGEGIVVKSGKIEDFEKRLFTYFEK